MSKAKVKTNKQIIFPKLLIKFENTLQTMELNQEDFADFFAHNCHTACFRFSSENESGSSSKCTIPVHFLPTLENVNSSQSINTTNFFITIPFPFISNYILIMLSTCFKDTATLINLC